MKCGVISVICLVVLTIVEVVKCDLVITAEDIKNQFEAAFQGRCDRANPCTQLCYDLHDGMYECDCRIGYDLHEDGYSCLEVNSTAIPPEYLLNNEEDVLYQKDAEFDAELNYLNGSENYTEGTTQGPRLEQKRTEVSGGGAVRVTTPLTTTHPPPCPLECGAGGGCVRTAGESPRCLCPLGRGGDLCEKDVEIRSPRFTGASWLAFPALRGAYKHVQVTLELRPEAYDGIFFLTGERDDMAGDFMALLLHQGFVEFRFDCGSGIGVVRSEETILLNQWNHVTLYRHRWDAWLQLNGGKHVQGRSKGLFSRITFREPLFLGGAGNTTGLGEKLPVVGGLRGCIRHLEVNDHLYRFALDPVGEAAKGYGIEECTADRCSRVPCQHGGKCLTSITSDVDEDDVIDSTLDSADTGGSSTPQRTSAVCLCPLGFTGDLCEIRVDLQVAAFNGSSHLRYRGLGDSALTWLDVTVVLKPTARDGLLLYNGQRVDGRGDFMALYLSDGHVEFAYDLGTGMGVVRSLHPITLSTWHEVRVSRTGRLATLEVDTQLPVEHLSPGAFTQLSLPQNLYLGGVPGTSTPKTTTANPSLYSSSIAHRLAASVSTSFVGCIQRVVLNGRVLSILAEALGGANVDNCPHPCVARPCGEDGDCIPELDYFRCKCRPGYRDQLCSRGPPSFTGSPASYLHYGDAGTLATLVTDPLAINVRVKLSHGDGLLLWLDSGSGDFLSLGVEGGGALVLRYTVRAAEMVVVVDNGTRVDDGMWHRISAIRNGGSGTLVIDNTPTPTHQSVDRPQPRARHVGVYVAGLPGDVYLGTGGRYRNGVRGCVADLLLNTDYHLSLVTGGGGGEGATSGGATGATTAGRDVTECEL